MWIKRLKEDLEAKHGGEELKKSAGLIEQATVLK